MGPEILEALGPGADSGRIEKILQGSEFLEEMVMVTT